LKGVWERFLFVEKKFFMDGVTGAPVIVNVVFSIDLVRGLRESAGHDRIRETFPRNARMENCVDTLIDLVDSVLDDGAEGNFEKIARFMAGVFDAEGAIVWEIGPGIDLAASDSDGWLFALAAWSRAPMNLILGDLPLRDSKAGKVVARGEVEIVSDIWSDPEVDHDYRILHESHVGSLAAAPVDLPGNSKGVVCLYRDSARPPFTDEDKAPLRRYAVLAANLLKAIRDKINMGLVNDVKEIISKPSVSPGIKLLSPEEELDVVFHAVCDAVADAFHCMEVSVVVEDQLRQPGVYHVVASTWDRPFTKVEYRRDASDGMTGWCMAHNQSIRILDLANFERDKDSIQKVYPGLTWRDPLSLVQTVREDMGLVEGDELPPLTYMMAPIQSDGKVVGVIRCSVVRFEPGFCGPYFFSGRDEEYLQIIAGQLGQYWRSWKMRGEIHDENEVLNGLVEQISNLNALAASRLENAKFGVDVFPTALEMMARVLDDADALDIRFLDEEKRELYFDYTYGRIWSDVSNRGDVMGMRFPVDKDPPVCLGARVYQTKEPVVWSDEDQGDESVAVKRIFPDSKHIIVVPIRVGGDIVGVLDIHGMGEAPFPKIALPAADLMGRQLGLYYHLALTFENLQETQAELRKTTELQSMMFQDLAHQLRGPLVQAQRRTLRLFKYEDKLPAPVQKIRGLVRKATRVAGMIKTLSNLYSRENIRLSKSSALREGQLVRMLIEAADDNQIMTDPEMNIEFEVNRASFAAAKIDSKTILVDYDLIEQAVNALLDNAGKYSFENTKVLIYGGMLGKDHFHITVRNVGLKIGREEVPNCVARGWRGRKATLVTGEGSGIGLWLVHHIMRAHGGEVVIRPTNENNETDVSLVLPMRKAH
jgi:signal transduction histidine kinase